MEVRLCLLWASVEGRLYFLRMSINVYGYLWKAARLCLQWTSINVYGRPWKAYNAVEDTLGRHYVPFWPKGSICLPRYEDVLHIGVMADWSPANRKKGGRASAITARPYWPSKSTNQIWTEQYVANWSYGGLKPSQKEEIGCGASAITVCPYWPSKSTNEIWVQ